MHHCSAASTGTRSKDASSTSSGKSLARESAGEKLHTLLRQPYTETLPKKFVSGLQLLPGASAALASENVAQRHANLVWEPRLLPVKQSGGTSGKKSGFFCPITTFPHRQTAQSIFCIELRKKKSFWPFSWLEGRRKYKKANAQTHRFICWSSHLVLSYSRQLLLYYQHLISI